VPAVTHPELFGFGDHPVRIELDDTHTRGVTPSTGALHADP
jgi:hypothetical protein